MNDFFISLLCLAVVEMFIGGQDETSLLHEHYLFVEKKPQHYVQFVVVAPGNVQLRCVVRLAVANELQNTIP